MLPVCHGADGPDAIWGLWLGELAAPSLQAPETTLTGAAAWEMVECLKTKTLIILICMTGKGGQIWAGSGLFDLGLWEAGLEESERSRGRNDGNNELKAPWL